MAQNLGFPVQPPQGSAPDKEDRNRDEQLHKLSSGFAPFPDPNLALHLRLREFTEEIRSSAGRGSCTIGLLEGSVFICRAGAGTFGPSLGAEIDADDFLTAECVRSHYSHACQDTQTDPRVDAMTYRVMAVRSAFVVPLLAREQLIGILQAFSPDSHAFGMAVRERIENVARKIVDVVAPEEVKPQIPAPVRAQEVLAEEQAGRSLEKSTDAVVPPPITTPIAPPQAQFPIRPLENRPAPEPPLHEPPAQEHPIPREMRPLADTLPAPRRQSRQNLVLAFAVLAAGFALASLLWWVEQEKLRRGVLAAGSATPVTSMSSPPSAAEDAPAGARTLAESKPEAAPETKAQHISLPSPNAKARRTYSEGAGPPSEDLVVYEKGKVIYRSGPAGTTTIGGPVTSASETERLVPAPAPAAASPDDSAGGTLLRHVAPVYPAAALTARVEGDVVLLGVIGKDGTVHEIRAVRGDPRLVNAAIDAVHHWRYDPFRSNGEPVDMLSTLTVHFRLPRTPNQ